MNTECAICGDDVKSTEYLLDCEHNFHKDCICPWITMRSNVAKTCPVCRAKVHSRFIEQCKGPNVPGNENYTGEWISPRVQALMDGRPQSSLSTTLRRCLNGNCNIQFGKVKGVNSDLRYLYSLSSSSSGSS